MNVLILNTNRDHTPRVVIPLGACSVASAARAAGHDTRLIDLAFERRPAQAAAAAVREFVPDVPGLSVRNLDNCDLFGVRCYLTEVKHLVGACRAADARIPRVVNIQPPGGGRM